MALAAADAPFATLPAPLPSSLSPRPLPHSSNWNKDSTLVLNYAAMGLARDPNLVRAPLSAVLFDR